MFPYERPGLVDCSVDISHGQPVAWLYRLRIRERMQCRENVGALHQPPARHGWKCRERVQGLPANVIRNRTHGVRRSYPSVTSSLNPPTSGSGRLSRRQQRPRDLSSTKVEAKRLRRETCSLSKAITTPHPSIAP